MTGLKPFAPRPDVVEYSYLRKNRSKSSATQELLVTILGVSEWNLNSLKQMCMEIRIKNIKELQQTPSTKRLTYYSRAKQINGTHYKTVGLSNNCVKSRSSVLPLPCSSLSQQWCLTIKTLSWCWKLKNLLILQVSQETKLYKKKKQKHCIKFNGDVLTMPYCFFLFEF